MKDLERLLYDMARWMQRSEILVESPAYTSFMGAVELQEYELFLAEGRLLRERADRAVGFPRGVR